MFNKKGNALFGFLIIVLIIVLLVFCILNIPKESFKTIKYRSTYIHKVKDMESDMQYVLVFPDGQAFYSETLELAKALVNERIILKVIEKQGKS